MGEGWKEERMCAWEILHLLVHSPNACKVGTEPGWSQNPVTAISSMHIRRRMVWKWWQDPVPGPLSTGCRQPRPNPCVQRFPLRWACFHGHRSGQTLLPLGGAGKLSSLPSHSFPQVRSFCNWKISLQIPPVNLACGTGKEWTLNMTGMVVFSSYDLLNSKRSSKSYLPFLCLNITGLLMGLDFTEYYDTSNIT